mgnify:CR=1 FL=1
MQTKNKSPKTYSGDWDTLFEGAEKSSSDSGHQIQPQDSSSDVLKSKQHSKRGRFSPTLDKIRSRSSSQSSQESHPKLEGRKGRGGKRLLDITVEYEPESESAGHIHGRLQGDMFREIIAARGIISEDSNDPETVGKVFYNLGRIPAWILAGDADRWHCFIYAAEMLRRNPEWVDSSIGLKELRDTRCRTCGCDRHAPVEEMVNTFAVWGNVDTAVVKKQPSEPPQKPLDTPKEVLETAPEPKKPDLPPQTSRADASTSVREQVISKKEELIDKTRAEAAPAHPVEEQDGPHKAYMAKWVLAEAKARQPRDTWEGKHDYEFESMIKYCYGWLRDIGEVPSYPADSLSLFWPAPLPRGISEPSRVTERRNFIAGKVLRFWQKSMNQDGAEERIRSRKNPLSYRVVLAAMKLSSKIEFYADPDPIHGEDDSELVADVKKAAVEYFKAHFPIGDAGPIATSDPSYVEYLQLCRTYNLKEGTLLHDANL